MSSQLKTVSRQKTLKPGQRVKVYADPFNKKTFEGEAILVEKLADYESYEFWLVRCNGWTAYRRFMKEQN